MNDLFFSLIRVAIGNQEQLYRVPTVREWEELYHMAQKQALLGICFAGVQKLSNIDDPINHTPYTIHLPKEDYLRWMAMAAKIQQRNEIMNRQCIELQTKLYADGFKSCILKGPGISQLYAEHLRGLRQSGDIDIWIEGDRDKALDYFKQQGMKVLYTSIKHAQVELFDDTEVEVHSRPSWFYSPIHDKIFMRWTDSVKSEQFDNVNALGVYNPNIEFNLVFILTHIYRHLFEEGIGLRQLLDYYFVLSASNRDERRKAYKIVCRLGMRSFAAAVMHVMKEVFEMKQDLLLCKAASQRGRELQEEILIGGNFGKFDTRYGERRKGRLSRGLNTIERNMRFIYSYPSEILWAPVWKIWHWCWRKKHGYI